MKKIVVLLVFLAVTVWLAWEAKEYVLTQKSRHSRATARASDPQPSSTPEVVTRFQEKLAAGAPVRIGETDLTTIVRTAVASQGASSQAPFIRNLRSEISPRRVRFSFNIDVNTITPESLPDDLLPLWENLQDYLTQFGSGSIPVSVDVVPKVYNGRVILTEGMTIRVANVTVSSSALQKQLEPIFRHLTQTGIVPARASKIELKNGELLLIP